MHYELEYGDLLKVNRETLDGWIAELHYTINTSDNYDWEVSYIQLVDNLKNGHFDPEIYDNELHIFGILIETLDEETKGLLLEEYK